MKRVVYHIISLRAHYPSSPILLAKYDVRQAFQRIHYEGSSAVRCISIFEDLAYLQLRMTFGGSNCPSTWCSTSKIIADIANELLDTADWQVSALHWPLQHLVPPHHINTDATPFEPSLETMVLPPPRPQGMVNIYIDDAIQAFLGEKDYLERGSTAVPLAVHILARPYSELDIPHRDHMLALSKLKAEGGPREEQIILGWRINT
jgi:hypothetical protein